MNKYLIMLLSLMFLISGCSDTDYLLYNNINDLNSSNHFTYSSSKIDNITLNNKINLNGTYIGGSAFVCVYNNGTLFINETSCP